jgi:hypothetical protein
VKGSSFGAPVPGASRQVRRDPQLVNPMSLIDLSLFDRIALYPESGGRSGGRDEACEAVEDELAQRGPNHTETAVALRSYGEGCVVVGIAGPVDRATARELGTLLRGLRPFSTRELLLTFVRVGPWDPQLVRVIGQARVHHLIDGGRLDLRGAPPTVVAAMGALPASGTPVHPASPSQDREPCLEEWGLRP